MVPKTAIVEKAIEEYLDRMATIAKDDKMARS